MNYKVMLPLVLVCAGCASNAPKPEYGMMSNGTYILSPSEKAMTCPQLTKKIDESLYTVAKNENYRNATMGVSVGLAVLTVVASGGRAMNFQDMGSGSYSKNAQAARAQAMAYNDELIIKKCKAVDIEARVTAAKAKINTEKPEEAKPE